MCCGVSETPEQEESEMNATTVSIDLAKNVFELAVADAHGKVAERARLTRAQLERWFDNREVKLVVMEACGSAHHWARTLHERGIEVRLLPAQYVRAYVKRNKTDAADCLALLGRRVPRISSQLR
jgi:transposase